MLDIQKELRSLQYGVTGHEVRWSLCSSMRKTKEEIDFQEREISNLKTIVRTQSFVLILLGFTTLLLGVKSFI